jgi:hypothetical protein
MQASPLPGHYRLDGLVEYGFPARLDLDRQRLCRLAAGLPLPVGQRPLPPAIAGFLSTIPDEDRAPLATLWNGMLSVRSQGTLEECGEALPVTLIEGLS